jgi:hypothetical protein
MVLYSPALGLTLSIQVISDEEAATFVQPPPPRPSLLPLVPGVDVVIPSTVVEWQTSIALEVSPFSAAALTVYIKGKSVRAVSSCLLDLIIYSERRKADASLAFAMEDSDLEASIIRTQRMITTESFFLPTRMIEFVVQPSARSP